MFIYVKKLVESAMIPARANKTDAGYDLWSVESYTLKPLERKLFKTGIAVERFYINSRTKGFNAYNNQLMLTALSKLSGYGADISGVVYSVLTEKCD